MRVARLETTPPGLATTATGVSGDDDHDRDIEGESDTQVLFRHANKTVIGCDHEESIIGLGAEKSEDGGPQIPLVTSQVSEGYHFSLSIR